MEEYCWVVPCVKCGVKNKNIDMETPNGCASCGMLDYLCYETKEKAVESFMKTYPEYLKTEIKNVSKK